MEVKKVKIIDPNGLHMRRAADVVGLSKKYKSKVYLCCNCKFADTCSILEVLTLAATKDAELAVIAEGTDEKEALKKISELFENGAGI